MTDRDKIIRMAREAGATTVDADDPQCWIGLLAFTRQELEHFYRAALPLVQQQSERRND